ncbi:outer membrane beta-barrel protein [Yoonia sp. GPGPB17]|uniref:outer membrane protein n=1 Tax=Yoonia sp. GPGPB17 TaxID=3026147 RepID=UPI0030C0E44F
MTSFRMIGVVACVATTALGGAAIAQDFEQDWEGFYGGLHLDASMYSVTTTDPNNSFLNDFPEESLIVGHGGLMGGYNYRLDGNLLIGAELDYTSELAIDDFFSSNEAETTGLELDWRIEGITTLRGRAGFVQGNALSFISIGVANATINMETFEVDTASTELSCDTSTCAKATEDLLGLTVGAGVDWAFREDWIGRVEIQHYAFENVQTQVLNSDGDPFCGETDQCTVGYAPEVTSIRFGVSYMF